MVIMGRKTFCVFTLFLMDLVDFILSDDQLCYLTTDFIIQDDRDKVI